MLGHLVEIHSNDIYFIVGFSIGMGIADTLGLLAMQYLVDLISTPSRLDYLRIYLTVVALGLSWLLKYCCSHNFIYESAVRARVTINGLVLMIYKKIISTGS